MGLQTCAKCGEPFERSGRRRHCERCRDAAALRRSLKNREYRRSIPSEAPEAKRERERRRNRSSKTERGYGAEHARERRKWEPLVKGGSVVCARCGEPIHPGEPWHLDHSDDREGYLGPSHRRCNLAGSALTPTEVRRRREAWDAMNDASRERQERLYGKEHAQQRKEWKRQVDAGTVRCTRCLEPISPSEPWDLGHDDLDETLILGPEHRSCNRSAGGRKAVAGARSHHSRDWLS